MFEKQEIQFEGQAIQFPSNLKYETGHYLKHWFLYKYVLLLHDEQFVGSVEHEKQSDEHIPHSLKGAEEKKLFIFLHSSDVKHYPVFLKRKYPSLH